MSLTQFTDQIAKLALLSQAELDAVARDLQADSSESESEQLARLLVERRLLTSFQTRQILAGKGKSLVLGNYVILDKLGQGGMGLVLKAQHRRMKRLVALKVLSPSVAQSAELLARFHREVEAAAKLEHPHIVTAYDADQAQGVHFLVMQFVDGQDLSTIVKSQGPLPIGQAVHYILQAARGLEYAHRQGVIHRDIKPANLLLARDGTVKILDMGLARIEGDLNQQTELTTTGAVMGTVDYMAPEQAISTRNADARSDLYSLGITLWYLLKARAAYEGDSMMARLLAHREAPIPSLLPSSPDEAREAIRVSVDAVFRKMAAKKPGDRYRSMSELIVDLESCLKGEGPAGASWPAHAEGASEESGLSRFLAQLPSGPAATAPPVSVKAALDATILAEEKKASIDSNGPTIELGGGRSPGRSPSHGARTARPKGVFIAAGLVGLLLLSGIVLVIQSLDGQGTGGDRGRDPAMGNASVTPAEPPSIRPIPQDSGLRFDGVDDHVLIDSLRLDSLPRNQPLTIEFAARPTSEKVANPFSWLGRNWIAVFTNGTQFGVGHLRETPILRVADQSRPPGGWTRVAAVFDGRDWALYLDGERQGTSPISFNLLPTDGGLYLGGAPLEKLTGHTEGRWFAGEIDEIRISGIARYAEDRYEPTDVFVPDGDTLALYHCDEAAGTTLRDAGGNGHHGTLFGAAWGAGLPVRTDADVRTSLAPQFRREQLADGDWADVSISGETVAVDVGHKRHQLWHDFPNLISRNLTIRTAARMAPWPTGGYLKVSLVAAGEPDYALIITDADGSRQAWLMSSETETPLTPKVPLAAGDDRYVPVAFHLKGDRLSAEVDGRPLSEIMLPIASPRAPALAVGGWKVEFQDPTIEFPAAAPPPSSR